jgi:DmsE family decaheme c-type cytochrome
MLRMQPAAGTGRVPPRHANRAHLAVMAVVLLIAIHAGSAQDKAGAPAAPTASTPADNKPAEYIGSEMCAACHEDIAKAFAKNPHHVVDTDKKRGFETKACESCHGPGSKHGDSMNAADIRNPFKMKPADADKVCLGCHLNQPTHVGRINSSHARNQVSCVACHSIHKNGPNGLVARKPAEVNEQCAKCHADVWASFQRPYKHRLPEGAMSCVDCHNPHGTLPGRSLQTANANEPGCFKCHGDKRGPFTFEHAPVRLEGCTACHQPHGSANPRMLTRQEVRFVCLECHSNLPSPTPANGTLGTVPPGFHNLNDPRFRNCNVCHQMVHGSYASRDFLK